MRSRLPDSRLRIAGRARSLRSARRVPRLGLALALIGLLSLASVWARPPDMVQIEVEVFEVIHEAGQDLGISWNWVNTNPSGDLKDSFARFPVSLNERGQVTLEVLDTRFGVLTTSIEAALRRGNAKLLSRPTLVTLDGKKAFITSGEELPFNDFKKTINAQQYVVAFKNTGVNLEVTPKIVRTEGMEDRVHLTVNTEVSEVARFERFENREGVWELPVISKRGAQTPLLVNDRSTIVMGGLLEQRHRTTERSVPGLSGIPVLGGLFRSKSERDLESEVIIFITPTVLRPGLPGESAREERIRKIAAGETADGKGAEVVAQGTGGPQSEAPVAAEPPAERGVVAESAGLAEPTVPEAPVIRGEQDAAGLLVADVAHVLSGAPDGLPGPRTELVVTGSLENRGRETVRDTDVEVTLVDRAGAVYDTHTVSIRGLRAGRQRSFKVVFKDFDALFLSEFDPSRIQVTAHER